MPAAAVIPAPGVHGIIAETKTSVVGIIDPATGRLARQFVVVGSSTARGTSVLRRSASVTQTK